MSYSEAVERLRSIEQSHLLDHWESLSQSQKERLEQQILHLDFSRFDEQRAFFQEQPQSKDKGTIGPLSSWAAWGNQEREKKGLSILQEGKVGCLVLSGGQGTRLRFPEAKGLFPITLIHGKSLYQLVAEKILAASERAERSLPVAFMTSTLNDEEVQRAFVEHHRFGLEEKQCFFFSQGNYPALDDQGNLFLEGPATVSEGPNGNGGALSAFVESEIFSQWVEQGVRYVHVIQIDNPLADPFDAEMIGLHEENGFDAVLKATEREDSEEKVGLIVEQDRKIIVKEYFEISPLDRDKRDQENTLFYRHANLTNMTLAMDFIKLAHNKGALPLHQAKKWLQWWVPAQKDQAKAIQANKYEMFLFDVLQRATTGVGVLLAPRERCFAPLKNTTGRDGILHVQEALEKRDRIVYQEVTKKEPPDQPFELDPWFYYPTEKRLHAWKGKL